MRNSFSITEGRYVMKEVQNPSMTALQEAGFMQQSLLWLCYVCIAIFDYTKFGYDYNALKKCEGCGKYRYKRDIKCHWMFIVI